MNTLRKQRLGLAVGAVAGVALTLAVIGGLVLAGGSDTQTDTPARPAPRAQLFLTLRDGDIVRDPRTGTRCEATGEGGVPNLLCTHTHRGRYSAVFWADELQVYGPGSGPMEPTYSFGWWPKLRP